MFNRKRIDSFAFLGPLIYYLLISKLLLSKINLLIKKSDMSEKEKGTVERKVRFNQDEETGKKSRNDKGFTRGRGGRGKGQPQRPRPTLDVFSPNLIHLWNVR